MHAVLFSLDAEQCVSRAAVNVEGCTFWTPYRKSSVSELRVCMKTPFDHDWKAHILSFLLDGSPPLGLS